MITPRGPKLASMALYIGWPLAYLFAFDIAVAVAYVYLGQQWIALPHIPLTIFGGAIGVIIGFRNNSSYARWWEARTLWGSIVNYSRTLARQAVTLITSQPEQPPQDELFAMRRTIIHYQIAFVHSLRCQLRKQEPWEELARVLGPEQVSSLRDQKNPAFEIQTRMGGAIEECFRRSWLDTIRWTALDSTLTALANAQGGAERIANTPMPKQYDYFPQLFVNLYCILLPLGMVANLGLFTPIGSTLVGFIFLALDKIGRDLEGPFDNTVHDVPLTSICRTIEINLRQQLGEPDVPAPLQPVRGVLW
jgi:putative membrane protein